MWKICVEEAVLFCSHSTWKSLRLQRAYHNGQFIHFCFFYENQICLHWFFLCFSPSQAVIIAVASNKRQKCPFLEDKSYWISNKNNNVTCVIGWFFIILFRFSLSFICIISCVVGSCNFGAPENLKCVRQKWLIITNITNFSFYSSFQGKHYTLQKHIYSMSQVHFKIKHCYIE